MKTIMAIWEWVKADVAKGKPSTWVNPSNITPPLTEEEKAILQQYKLERDFVLSANALSLAAHAVLQYSPRKMPLRRIIEKQ